MTEPRTKIHCTCGPACRDAEVLRAMIRAGADVFRVNGAHADGDEIAAWIDLVREAARAEDRAAAVLVDLPGPKFRVGALAAEAGFELAPGAPLRMDGEEAPGDGRRVGLREMRWFADVPVGAAVVVGDGGARLEVVSAGARGVELRAIDAVGIREGVGVHFPGLALPTAVPTRRDRALLKAAVEAGADMISQSFVRTPDDVARLRELVHEHGGKRTLVIAKIERLDAVLAADAILAQADGALLGRGDLGIDAGVEAVPSLQKRVLEAGRRTGRPVVIATEMLESMVHSLRPTRAEASDVAGAVYEGADGVMLSAETAIGRHPAHVVATMAGILAAAEADPAAPYAGRASWAALPTRAGRPDQHVVHAAVGLARETQARAILVFTRTGASAVRMSKERPEARIHAFAPSDAVCRRLTLAWGVRPTRLPECRGTDQVFQFVKQHMESPEVGLAAGDRAVLVMGSLEDPAGTTTVIKLFVF
jgi:pyruvate kinase